MKERVLITGASGFVGYHLIEEALKKGLEVFAAVRKSSDIAHLKEFDIKYTYPDFSSEQALLENIDENKYDYIIHAAGITKALRREEYEEINANYTYNLASAAAKSKSPVKKFVLISSLAAVGPSNDINGVITENTPPAPVTAYGRSKLLAEDQLKSVAGLNYTILRPTGVYGPRDKDILILFKQLANRLELYIGRMEQKLSLIYVTDLAKAAIQALTTGDMQTYHLSDGNFYSRYELGNVVKDVLNLTTLKIHLPVIFVKFIAYTAQKYSSLSGKASALNVEKLNELMAVNWDCSIEQARTGIGFTPVYDLKAGITETMKWYKANKWL